jgi:hypothetical protein
MMGFTFAQPFLVSRAIALTTAPPTERNDNFGYGLIGAYAIVYTGIAVCGLTNYRCHSNN